MTPRKKNRLQPVLKQRQFLEDEAGRLLGRAVEAERKVQVALDESGDRHRELVGALEERRRNGLTVPELLLQEARITGLEERIASLKRELAQRQEEIAGRRCALLEASRNRKLIEKLMEKHAAAERQESLRQEAITLDEVALQGARREGR